MGNETTLMDVLESRAASYGMLSRLYREEVNREYYEELISLKFPAHTGNADVDSGYRLLCGYLSQAHPDVIMDLAVDYTRTFLGSGTNGYSAAYPFESVYTSPKRLLMQAARDEVLVIYRAAGLSKKPSWKDGEDHIALELEYMQIMGQRALAALERGDEEGSSVMLELQKLFLDAHLLSWFPMMAADMEKFAKTDFYKGLAALTMGVLANDREFLDEILSSDEEGR